MRQVAVSKMLTNLKHLVGVDSLLTTEENSAIRSFNRFGRLAWERTKWPDTIRLEQKTPDNQVRNVSVGTGGTGYTAVISLQDELHPPENPEDCPICLETIKHDVNVITRVRFYCCGGTADGVYLHSFVYFESRVDRTIAVVDCSVFFSVLVRSTVTNSAYFSFATTSSSSSTFISLISSS